MESQLPRDQNDLSDFERRLAGWQPNTESLEADAMLFAAGLAAGRRGARPLWPALCALLIIQVVCLGAWGISERSQRLVLVGQLGKGVPVTGDLTESVGIVPKSGYTPLPNDYFHQRRRVEQDASYYLAFFEPARPDALGHPLPQAEIMRAGRWSDLLD